MTTTAGWHPDPAGDHHYRYWDGTGWTDKVADGGVTSIDPLTTAHPAPTEVGADRPAPAVAEVTPEPPKPLVPTDRKGPNPIPVAIAVAVVVALVVGAVFLLTKDAGDDGTGDFSYKVDSTEFTTHTVELEAGEQLAFRVSKADEVRVAYGISQTDIERYLNSNLATASDDIDQFVQTSNDQLARILYDLGSLSDVSSELDDAATDEVVAAPGFDGYVLGNVFEDEIGENPNFASTSFIAPIDMTVTILLIAPKPVEVDLRVRISDRPDLDVEGLSSEEFVDLDEDQVYSDFEDSWSDEFELGG